MKVCDRHIDRRAIDTILLTRDDTRIDVCEQCKTEVLNVLTAPANAEPRRTKPTKELAKAN